jgi:hypothetical protein
MNATKQQLDDLDAALEKEADKLDELANRLETGNADRRGAAEELHSISAILRGTIEKDPS